MPDPVFPLGLIHVNAALRRAGHLTRLLDLLLEPQALERTLLEFEPDVVGVSLRNIDDVLIRKQATFFGALVTICETVRRTRPCPVVVGGSGFSIYPERLLELSGADFGIRGDGEESLVALLGALEARGDYTAIPGLVHRQDGMITANPPARGAVAAPLEEGDMPAELAAHYLQSGGMLNVQTQRGCGHTCCYCTYPLIEGRVHRRRPPDLVADEMARLEALGARYAFIVDAIFNSSPRHVTETCEAIIRRGLRLRWGCFLRPQGLTDDLMQLMQRAGLAHIEFGSDSFSDAVLEQCGKRLTFEDILQSSTLARRAEIEHCHFLVCGGPGETVETLDATFQNAQRLPAAIFLAVVGMRVYPGTDLARHARSEARVPTETDLLEPRYYLATGLTVEGVFGQLRGFAQRSASWVVGDPTPEYERFVARLRHRGIVGPLWSYFAMLQRIRPQPAAVGAG